MAVRHRVGGRTRIVDVPVCQACATALRQESGEEERRRRLTWVLTAAGLVVGLVAGWFVAPAPWMEGLRLAIALATGLAISTLAWTWGRRGQSERARPEKQAVRQAARIVHFSWRAITFEFSQDAYAEAFAALNKSRLMSV